MDELRRFTTEYVEDEDRIRISGELRSGEKVVLWVTRRLADRLVPPVAAWLERQADPPEARSASNPAATAATRSFVQQAARAELPKQAPVDPGPAPSSWLVRSVDLGQGATIIRLTFRNRDARTGAVAADEVASTTVAMAPVVARQWLGIVHDKYRKAGWSTRAFPRWVTDSPAGAGQAASATLH
jgi:hypothetical protein